MAARSELDGPGLGFERGLTTSVRLGCFSCVRLSRSVAVVFFTRPTSLTFKVSWLSYVPSGLTFNNSTFCPHSVFMCFVWISEQTAIISLYNINWLVSITEMESVYCVVRTGSFFIILRSAHTVYLRVLCGSENKQRLFPYTTLIGWFLYPRRGVFTARYGLCLSI